jgi:hypothetical protein
MPIYKCINCNKVFKQKSHHTNHINRKTPCKKTELSLLVTENNKIISKKHETRDFSWYHDNMPEIFNFVVNKLDPSIKSGARHIIICAEVKTGKRFIAQAQSVYNSSISGESYAQVFISSWIRRDDDGQRKELNIYFKGTTNEPRVFKINTEKSRLLCIKKLKELVLKYEKVIVHHDELDYGSGHDQHMAAVYEYCIYQEKICLISYSATYEEALVENSIDTNNTNIKPVKLKFKPSENYRGVKWFCDNKLVEEAKPFFEEQDNDTIILSEQAKKIISDVELDLNSDDPKINRKKLLIVRVNTPFEKTKDLIDSEIFPELRCHNDIRILPQFIHSKKELNTMTVKWDDYQWWKRQMEIERGDGKFILILFIEQSSTRSTDWFCHPWLNVYHDYHPPNSSVSCSGQSNPRIVYYTNKMCNGIRVYNEEFFPKLYGQKDIIEYMAGYKKLRDLNRPVSSRAKIFDNLNTFGPVLQIKFTEEEMEIFKADLYASLNSTTKISLNNVIRKKLPQELAKLKPVDRKLFEDTNLTRTLRGKRVFTKDSANAGGIYTVALKKLRNITSGPGGGVGDEESEAYNNRGKYYWIDVARDDLELIIEEKTIKIPKGTVYITFGIPDPPTSSDSEEDDNEEDIKDDKLVPTHKIKSAHRKTGKCMYNK